jgi:hypothetical protein
VRDLRSRLALLRDGARQSSGAVGVKSLTTQNQEDKPANADSGNAADLSMDPGNVSSLPPEWKLISPFFWMRECSLPIPAIDTCQSFDLSPFSVRLKNIRLSLSDLCFFDLETTGLLAELAQLLFWRPWGDSLRMRNSLQYSTFWLTIPENRL